MKPQTIVIFVLLAIVAFAIGSTTITVLHYLIGIPQGAALGVGLAFGVFAVLVGMNFFKGLF